MWKSKKFRTYVTAKLRNIANATVGWTACLFRVQVVADLVSRTPCDHLRVDR